MNATLLEPTLTSTHTNGANHGNGTNVTEAARIRSFFDENGFYLAKGVFSPGEIAPLETDFDRIVDQLRASNEEVNGRWGGAAMERMGVQDTVIYHTHNVQNYSEVWHRALLQNRFLDAAGAILGPDIILHHSKLFQKPQGKGAPFPMHQDWEYFPTEKDSMIAGVIHVSEATDEMGCFRVYPGTHRLGRQTGMMGGKGEENALLAQYPLENATVVEAEPGDVLFFHYFLLHGSLQNTSDQIRKTVLVQMHAGDDAIVAGNQHTNARLTLRGWNHAVSRAAAAKI